MGETVGDLATDDVGLRTAVETSSEGPERFHTVWIVAPDVVMSSTWKAGKNVLSGMSEASVRH